MDKIKRKKIRKLENRIIKVAKRHGIKARIRNNIFRSVELRISRGENCVIIDSIFPEHLSDKTIANIGLRVTKFL